MRGDKRLLFLGIGLAWLAAAHPAKAQSCTISTRANVVFGNYSVYTATPVTATGRIRINCNNATNSVIVDLSRGNAPTFIPRYMLKGIEQLTYNLYLDAARTTIWGDNTGGTVALRAHEPPQRHERHHQDLRANPRPPGRQRRGVHRLDHGDGQLLIGAPRTSQDSPTQCLRRLTREPAVPVPLPSH